MNGEGSRTGGRSGDELIVVRGIASTQDALLAAHRPNAAGTACRECGHVYTNVRACPAAAETLEGCAALVAPAPAGPVEIVHVACQRRPRRSSGLWGWVLAVAVMLLVAGQLVSMLLPLPVVVHLAVAVATPVVVWRLAVVVWRISRREQEARRDRNELEPLV